MYSVLTLHHNKLFRRETKSQSVGKSSEFQLAGTLLLALAVTSLPTAAADQLQCPAWRVCYQWLQVYASYSSCSSCVIQFEHSRSFYNHQYPDSFPRCSPEHTTSVQPYLNIATTHKLFLSYQRPIPPWCPFRYHSVRMSRTNPFVAFGAVGGVILSLGYMVAEGAASHPIGQSIPDKKTELRTEGAQSESVKAGAKTPAQAASDIDFKTKGGDKGMKEING